MGKSRLTSPPIAGTRLIGHVGECVAHLVPASCGVLAVHVTSGVRDHYRKEHEKQMDIEYAESKLPSVLAEPLHVIQGKRAFPNS